MVVRGPLQHRVGRSRYAAKCAHRDLIDYVERASTLEALLTYSLRISPCNPVKLDLYGLKFYYQHVLQKPWVAPGLVKPPKVRHLPNRVTTAQLQQIVATTRVLSYRVFFFTLYSLGLRLSEGLHLPIQS